MTGAGKGLGRAIAIALAAEGVNVALVGRTEKDLVNVAEELKAYPIKTTIATADVADIEAVNAAVASVKSVLGPIDILVNNAGIASFGKFMELEPQRWKE